MVKDGSLIIVMITYVNATNKRSSHETPCRCASHAIATAQDCKEVELNPALGTPAAGAPPAEAIVRDDH